LSPIPLTDSFSESKKAISIKNLLAFKFDESPSSKTSAKHVPLTTRVNPTVEKENIKKDLEIVNLTSINKQLLKAQENKSELIKSYYQENNLLKKEISQMRVEIEALKNHITKLKFKIKHYKIAFQETGVNNNILNKMDFLINKDDTLEEKKEKNKKREVILNREHTPSSKIKGIPVPSMNLIKESMIHNFGLGSTLNSGLATSTSINSNSNSNTMNFLNRTGTGTVSGNGNTTGNNTGTPTGTGVLSFKKVNDKDALPSFFKSSLKAMNSVDHYKRLTLNYIRKYYLD
jgi:hypothetical protein